MLTMKFLAASLFLSVSSLSQPPQGTLQVKIIPKEIVAGDSVWFEAGLFSAGLCPYSSSYKIIPVGTESDSFSVLVQSEPTGGQCAAAFGFSGPQFHIAAMEPGQYFVRFDSSSQFKPNLGDTAIFKVMPSTSIQKGKAKKPIKSGGLSWRVDGRKASQSPNKIGIENKK